jgi:hypothetical protein
VLWTRSYCISNKDRDEEELDKKNPVTLFVVDERKGLEIGSLPKIVWQSGDGSLLVNSVFAVEHTRVT